MKYRIIEDGNGNFRIQEQIQQEWLNAVSNIFKSVDDVLKYAADLIETRERTKRSREVKRVVQEFDL